MDFIKSSLCRLHENVGDFVVPSVAFWDAPALRAQIELRQRVLTEIEIIRCRLRPFMRGENKWRFRKSRGRRPRITRGRR
jgi:hypothetical protein